MKVNTKLADFKYATLVLGLGNELLCDDAIGPKLTKRLEQCSELSDFKFETAFVGGLDVIDLIKNYQKVIFIDAIKTENGIPGTLYLFNKEDFKETLHLSNMHDISFLTALELGAWLGINIPPEIDIIAIEIREDLVFSNNFTPEVESKYDEIYFEIKDYLLSIN